MLGNKELIDAFIKQTSTLIESVNASEAKAELEQGMRTALSQLLTKLDVVSREEFDRQVELLARNEEKMADLESKLNTLMEQLDRTK